MPDKESSVVAQAERVIADLTSAGADLPLEQFMELAQGISDSPDAAQAIAYLLFEQTKRQKASGGGRDRDRGGTSSGGSGLTRYIIDGYEAEEAPEVGPIAEALGLDAEHVTVEASHRGGWLANIPRDAEAPGRAELKMGEYEVALRRMKPPGRDSGRGGRRRR